VHSFVVVLHIWLLQSLLLEHEVPSDSVPAPVRHAATTAVLSAVGVTYVHDSPSLQSAVFRQALEHPTSKPPHRLLAQSVSWLQLLPFWPVPAGPHQATYPLSKLAAPGNVSKRHEVPVAHWLGSFVPLVVQHVSTHTLFAHSPERQLRPVEQLEPPLPVPMPVSRFSHVGLTQ
jgi:hypothetical protein